MCARACSIYLLMPWVQHHHQGVHAVLLLQGASGLRHRAGAGATHRQEGKAQTNICVPMVTEELECAMCVFPIMSLVIFTCAIMFL